MLRISFVWCPGGALQNAGKFLGCCGRESAIRREEIIGQQVQNQGIRQIIQQSFRLNRVWGLSIPSSSFFLYLMWELVFFMRDPKMYPRQCLRMNSKDMIRQHSFKFLSQSSSLLSQSSRKCKSEFIFYLACLLNQQKWLQEIFFLAKRFFTLAEFLFIKIWMAVPKFFGMFLVSQFSLFFLIRDFLFENYFLFSKDPSRLRFSLCLIVSRVSTHGREDWAQEAGRQPKYSEFRMSSLLMCRAISRLEIRDSSHCFNSWRESFTVGGNPRFFLS